MKPDEENPARFENILLPANLVGALKKLNPTQEMQIEYLSMILNPAIFSEICEFLATPLKTKTIFDDLHFNFLELDIKAESMFYASETHGLFNTLNNLLRECVSYDLKQKGAFSE